MKKIYFIVLLLLVGSCLFAQPEQPCAQNISPANGATGIKVKNQILTFSYPSVPGNMVTLHDARVTEVIGGFEQSSGNTGSPAGPITLNYFTLKPSTTYSWRIITTGTWFGVSTTVSSNCTSSTFTTAALTCVNNISPINASTNQSLKPTFNWNICNGADSYDIYLGTSASNASLLINVNTNSYTLPINNSLLENTTYYWYVVPKNSSVSLAASGCSSNMTSFTTGQFSCVQNLLPANGTTVQSTIPTLTWNTNAGATSYDVYFGTTTNPTTLLANVTQSTYAIPLNANLLNNTTYYWYVVPKNGAVAATGCESDVTSFTTASLSCVSGISPAAGQTFIGLQTNLTWNATGASFYDVYVGTTNPPTTIVANVSTNAYSSSNYLPNTTYYWYVVPKNGNISATGCVSNVSNFTTGACALNSTPINGASYVSSGDGVILTWHPFPGAAKYDVYLSPPGPGYGNLTPVLYAANVTTNTYTVSVVAGQYYSWYVIPKNTAGVPVGCPSETFGFGTTYPITFFSPIYNYTCPYSYTPLDGATNVSLNPTLTWYGGGGPAFLGSYQLYMSTTPGATQPLIATNIVNSNTAVPTSYTIPFNNILLPNTTYYWYPSIKVGSAGGAGAPIYNCRYTVKFTTGPGPSPCVLRNLSPTNAATNVGVTTNLTWSAFYQNSNYIMYELHLGTDSSSLPVYSTFSSPFDTSINLSLVPLLPSTTYYWYVIPKESSTQTLYPACKSNITKFTTAPLACVSNTLPLNNATNVPIRPTLTWQANLAATEYNIYLDTSPNPTTNIGTVMLAANQNLVSNPFFTLNQNLLPNTTYYWYVVPRYNTTSAVGCSSNVTSFTTAALGCTANIFPANLSTGIALTPQLKWSKNNAATSYDVYFGLTNTSTTFLANATDTTFVIPTSLTPSTTYYWYVVPKNGANAATGCINNMTSFTTSNVNCTNNILPSNLSIGNVTIPTLTWQATPVATSYDIYLGTTAIPTTLIANVATTSYTIPIANALAPNTTYYWYVVPRNGNIVATGCTSNITSFTTSAIACVTNISPSNASTLINVRANLSWQVNAAATSYDVYLGTTNPPTTLFANVGTNSYTIPNNAALSASSTYYWYVVPRVGSFAATGCSANVTSFITYPLTCTYPVAPLNNTTNVNPTSMQVSWALSAGASNFDLYLGTTNPPNFFINSTNNSYTFSPANPLQPSTTYYWYAVAKNGANSLGLVGCENVNYIYNFRTRALNCPISNLPAYAGTNVSTTPTFNWSPNENLSNLSYDILLGTTNPPTTVIANTTNTNYTIPISNQLLENTTYYWNVISKIGNVTAGACASNIRSFTTIPSNCIPPYTYGCFGGTGLADFRLFGELGSSIAETGTVCPVSAPYYTNLTASTNVTLAAGKAYVGNMKSNSTGVYTSIWIDFNNNGGFEVNENLLNGLPNNNSYGTSGVPMPYSIFIPANAALGTHKMRVRTAYGNVVAPMQACATYHYGETKDFTVTIVPTGTAYAISTKANCEDLAYTTINAASNNNNTAVPILDNIGNIAATINANGNNLGTVTSSIHKNTGAVRQSSNGSYYFDRNLTITPETQPSSNVGVRLYYTAAELAAFQTAVPTATSNSLNVTKTNLGCSTSFAGVDVFLPQTGNGSMGSDYYIDVATPSFSSFYIKNGLGLLPISVVYFKGSKQQAANILDWKLNCDAGTSLTVTLERSSDGRSFNGLQTQSITDIMCANAFTYKDATPLAGTNYYRLQIKTASGEIKYSVIVVLLNKDKGFELISIVPNPVKNNALLTITSARAGKINIVVSDVAGKQVTNQTNAIIAGSNNINMNFETLASGTYFITALNADGEIKTTKFVKY